MGIHRSSRNHSRVTVPLLPVNKYASSLSVFVAPGTLILGMILTFATKGSCQSQPGTTLGTHPSVSSRPLIKGEDLIRDRLRAIAATEKCNLLVDINPDIYGFDASYRGPRGADAMQALARAVRCRWIQQNGVQILVTTPDRSATEPARQKVDTVLDWISSLPDDELQKLSTGKLHLGDLDQAGQDALMNMTSEVEPFMSFVFLDRGPTASINLSFRPMISWRDAKTGASQTTEIPTTVRDEEP
jgi:hypothetical protein